MLRWPLVTITMICWGCGSGQSDGPELHSVRGTVIMDSKPLSKARVIFTPKEGGRATYAETNSSGRYALAYSTNQMGTPAGEYIVSIQTGRDPEEDPQTGDESRAVPETIPAIYNRKSTLRVIVPGGKYNFDLQSDSAATPSKPSR